MRITVVPHKFELPDEFSSKEFIDAHHPIPLFKVTVDAPAIPGIANSIRRIIIGELPRYQLKITTEPNEGLYMSDMTELVCAQQHIIDAEGLTGVLDITNRTDGIMNVTLADVKWNRDVSKQMCTCAVIAMLLTGQSLKAKLHTELVSEHPGISGFNMMYYPEKHRIEYLTHYADSAKRAVELLISRLQNLSGNLSGVVSGQRTKLEFIGETMTTLNLFVKYVIHNHPDITYITAMPDPANSHVINIRHNSTQERLEKILQELIGKISS